MKYKPGDKAIVRIKDGICSIDTYTEIAGTTPDGSYIVLYLKGWRLDSTNKYNIYDSKYHNKKCWLVSEEDIICLTHRSTNNTGPITCKKCNKPYPLANPNQDDGSLICWACRNGL